MVTRGAAMAEASGVEKLRLFPTDWTFAKGHRVGVLVSGANAEAYVHVPTYSTVDVTGGTVTLPRSEEHTSELQSLMRNSYAVVCLNKKIKTEHVYIPKTK